MGSGLTFSLSVLRLCVVVIMPAYRTTAPSHKRQLDPPYYLPHDCYSPDHKEADRPVLLPTAQLLPSYPCIITPRTALVASPFFFTFLYYIPFSISLLVALYYTYFHDTKKEEP